MGMIILTFEVMEAVRGQKHQLCLPKNEPRFSLHILNSRTKPAGLDSGIKISEQLLLLTYSDNCNFEFTLLLKMGQNFDLQVSRAFLCHFS